jgi:hypothetical protein
LKALGYLWSLPNTLIGLLLALPYGGRMWRWHKGCIEIVTKRMLGKPSAQTWGCVIFYQSSSHRDSPALRVHERVHVVQSFKLGVFFLLAYAIHFGWLWLRNGRDYHAAYRGIWAEKEAYRIQDEFRLGERPDAWGG